MSRRALPIVVLAAGAVFCAVILATQWRVTTDLGAFLPPPESPAERFLVESLGNQRGAQLLLVGLTGDSPEALAAASNSLRDRLASRDDIAWVANGAQAAEQSAGDDTLLFDYRYLLSDRLTAKTWHADALREVFAERLQDLTSPVGLLAEDVLRADPTLESLALAERMQPVGGAQTYLGVWFDGARDMALLVLATTASGLDAAAQAQVIAAVQKAAADAGAIAVIGGPGAFAARVRADTRRDATRLSLLGSALILALLLLVYRAPTAVLLGALPLAAAVLAGMAAIALCFSTVHGITLAFGVTLLGVALDYPIHWLSRSQGDTRAAARAIWPSLRIGLLSTCVAYAALFAAGVQGLAQLAVMTIAGLLAAASVTRWVLPSLLQHRAPQLALPVWLGRFATWPAPAVLRLLPLAVLMLAAALLASRGSAIWQSDIAASSPVSAELLAQDRRLRSALGVPEARLLNVYAGQTQQAALEAAEAARATPLLPSVATQQARQQALPAANALRAAVDAAVEPLPLSAAFFEPFVAGVQQSRQAAPLTPDAIAGTALGQAMQSQLLPLGAGWALVKPAADASDTTDQIDLKQVSQGLIARYRGHVLVAMAIAVGLIAGLLWLLAGRALVWRCLMPVAAAVIGTAGIHVLAGQALSLFHLVSLILVGGLSLDYAMFFAREAGDAAPRTLHAVLVCAASTLCVFGVLATASIPVLAAIGQTVAIGVVLGAVFGFLSARPPGKLAP